MKRASAASTSDSRNPAFRADRHQEIHRLEAWLLGILLFEVVLMPWEMGGMRLWGQIGNLVLSVIALILALWPRYYDDRSEGQMPFWLYTWPKLIRFPVFWIGLLFLAYVVAQGLNPAWTFQSSGRSYWMAQIPHTKWLPAGMHAPFAQWNPWRSLLIYSTVWCTVCAMWIGLTRRRSYQLLFYSLILNGTVMAVLTGLLLAKGNGKVLWFIPPTTPYYVVTIPYKNHAATYFNLLLAVTAGFGIWYFVRGMRRFDRSNPAAVIGFLAAMISVAVAFTFSRAGLVLAAVLVLGATIAWFWYTAKYSTDRRSLLLPAALVMLLAVFVSVGANSLGFNRVIGRFHVLMNVSFENRALVRHATWEMARDRPIFGWGAGCFRYGFPIYQLRYEKITTNPEKMRMFWEHAHCDYLQAAVEFGSVGCAILLGLLVSGTVLLVRARFWRNPISCLIVMGIAVALAHAWVDFPFQSPLVLTTCAVLFAAAIRWAELDEW